MINQQFSIERSVDESIDVVKIPHCDRSIGGIFIVDGWLIARILVIWKSKDNDWGLQWNVEIYLSIW